MTWFAFVSAWFIYFNHSKRSSKWTPRRGGFRGDAGVRLPKYYQIMFNAQSFVVWQTFIILF